MRRKHYFESRSEALDDNLKQYFSPIPLGIMSDYTEAIECLGTSWLLKFLGHQ
jgi:uncharacterized membrane protein YGL010W